VLAFIEPLRLRGISLRWLNLRAHWEVVVKFFLPRRKQNKISRVEEDGILGFDPGTSQFPLQTRVVIGCVIVAFVPQYQRVI